MKGLEWNLYKEKRIEDKVFYDGLKIEISSRMFI